MPGSTTRLGLYKPGGGSTGTITPDEVADIDKLNDNFDDLDAAVGAFPCTSLTRPSTPFDGQIIRESDTGKVLIWAGGQWVEVAPGIILIGNTALRDAAYPAPGSASARVALANKITRFWNTDKGYEQQYYAQFDDSGIAATTPAKQVFGWGPSQHLDAVPLKPTSVGTTGGTAVLHGGKIEFAGSTVLNVNGIFSADFTNYYALLEMDSASVDAGLQFRMRAAGVDLTTSTYGINQIENTAAGSLGGGAPGAATSGLLGRIAGTGDSAQRIEIFKPFATKRTSVFGHSIDATLFQRLFSTSVQNALSYDGFTVIFNTTATGRLKFYGYNDY